MHLLILAAGVGSRLSPETDETPKCLLDISTNYKILDHQFSIAKDVGLKDIVIVAGYQIEKIEKHVEKYTGAFNSIRVVYNPFYKTTNNLVSLWLGLSVIQNDFVMMNGDTILHPKILSDCLLQKKSVLIPISRKLSYDSDDTKLVLNKDESIDKIGKKIDLEMVDAEWMGVAIFKNNSYKKLKEKTDELIRIPKLLEEYPHYLSVINGLITDGVKFETKEFSQHLWTEIDYQFDLDDARAHVKRYIN